MAKSTALTIGQQHQQIALVQEAEAHRALTHVVTNMKGYQDATGAGPKEDSLKGIMISTSRRIALRFGAKVPEMPVPMLRQVQQLKYDMGDTLKALMSEQAEYKQIKNALWALIDRYAEEYQRRQSTFMDPQS